MDATDSLGLAQMYMGYERWDEALRELVAVIAAEPDNAEALVLVSSCHLALGNPQEALAAANSAGRARPDWPAPLIARSAALLKVKQVKEANEAAAAAVRLAPSSVHAHIQLINADGARRRPTSAGRDSAKAALALAPSSPSVHVAVGNLELRRGKVKSAEASYREALRLDPDNRAAQFNLAWIKQRYGGFGWSMAIKLLLGLVKVAPDDPTYSRLLRSTMAGVLIVASLACVLAILLVAPQKDSPDLSPGIAAAALGVALVFQGAAFLLLRKVAGPTAFRFLMGFGWRRKAMIGAFVGLGLVDVCLALLIFFPQADAVLTGIALAAVFGALFAIVAAIAYKSGE